MPVAVVHRGLDGLVQALVTTVAEIQPLFVHRRLAGRYRRPVMIAEEIGEFLANKVVIGSANDFRFRRVVEPREHPIAGKIDPIWILDPNEVGNGVVQAVQISTLPLALGQRHRQFGPGIVTIMRQTTSQVLVVAAEHQRLGQIGQYRLEDLRQRQVAGRWCRRKQQDRTMLVDRQAQAIGIALVERKMAQQQRIVEQLDFGAEQATRTAETGARPLAEHIIADGHLEGRRGPELGILDLDQHNASRERSMKQQALQRLPEQTEHIDLTANGQRQVIQHTQNLLAIHSSTQGEQTSAALWNIG